MRGAHLLEERIQHGATAEWVNPLLRRRVADGGKRLFNIGGGTCQGYHRTGEISADEAIARFIRWYCDIAQLIIQGIAFPPKYWKLAGESAVAPVAPRFSRGIGGEYPSKTLNTLL